MFQIKIIIDLNIYFRFIDFRQIDLNILNIYRFIYDNI